MIHYVCTLSPAVAAAYVRAAWYSRMFIRPCLFAVKQCSVLETEHQAATFALIKSLIARQVLLPEVYDLMDDLCSLAVTSQRAPLRATCSSVFLQYLVSYPLGEKRLTQHLRQVLEGITYEHEVRVCIASHFTSYTVSQNTDTMIDFEA